MNLRTVARGAALTATILVFLVGCVPIQAPAPTMEEPAAGESGSGNVVEATFVCPQGTELKTVFDNDAHTVTIARPNGTFTLPQVESGSGAKYSDGTMTFWTQGDEALVEVKGEMVYQDCMISPTGDADAGAPADEPSGNVIEATFVCPDGTELPAVFDNDAHTVMVDLPDGTVTLPQTVSGSGARYSDDVTTFWNKGDEALVEVNGETVYQGCIAQ